MKREFVLASLNAGALMVFGGTLLLPLPMPQLPQLPAEQTVNKAPPRVNNGNADWPEAATVQRSLFRPLITAAVAPPRTSTPIVTPSEPAVDPVILLRGILSDGSRWTALIEIEGEPERRLVAPDDPIGAWVVGKVKSRSITLRRRGEQRELLLDPPQ